MKLYLISIFFIVCNNILAQENSNTSKLYLSAYIDNGKVYLRWTPDNYSSWVKGNSFGYSVFRSVLVSNSSGIAKPDSTFLGIFKPFQIEKWRLYSDSSLFAVAAESVYGKEFETTTQSSNFFDIVNKSREQESRFTFGMLCADQSFTVACMMGLGFIDSTVKSNETYLYKVIANYKDSAGYQEIGYVMVDFSYGNFLPKPFGISYFEDNGRVTINIPYEPFKGIYNNFQLERSEDGKNFKVVKDKSFYSLSTIPEDPKYTTYTDSVDNQALTVYYRLKGRTPFDAYGPYSDTLEVKVMPSLNRVPWITDIKELSNSNLSISWGFDNDKTGNLKGFMVYTSNNYEGSYKEYLNNSIDSSLRSTLIPIPNGYSYFKVGALDQFGRPYLSSPRLFQIMDSIPPSKPEGLVGNFDTSGIASLSWHFGVETDLLGYKVFYSTKPEGEYTLLSKRLIYDSTFTSRFTIDVLASEIYFKAQAIDLRYNASQLSKPLKLFKPDNISPCAPFIAFHKDSIGMSYIKISPSKSLDAKVHHLMFERNNELKKPIDLFRGKIANDTIIKLNSPADEGIVYCNVDDFSGRVSQSNKVNINLKISKEIHSFNIRIEPLLDDSKIKISWNSDQLQGSLLIYRKENLNSYNLIQTIDSKKGIFIDNNVTYNYSYLYKVIATLQSGEMVNRELFIHFK